MVVLIRHNTEAKIIKQRDSMNLVHSVEVQNLCQRVADRGGELTILDNISLNARPGEAIAITGSSGSGKSTLLGLMAGLDVPSSGTVRLMGHDLFSLDEEGRAALRAKHIGFVFQSFQLLPNLTALENVMLPLELTGQPALAAATQMLEKVGLKDRLRHYPKTLSGGEQQRVSLARAFVVNPDILFADEPTGSLDEQNGEIIIELMFRLLKEQNATLVMVTHDPAVAARCDRQLKLQGGRLAT